MRRFLPLLGVFAAGLVLGGAVIWMTRDDGDGGSDKVVAATSTTDPLFAPADANSTEAQFQRLLNAGRKLTFHVRYATQGQGGTTAELELWNRPPQARRDVRAVTNQGRVHSAEIRREKDVLRCVETEKTEWQCAPQPVSGEQDPGDLTLGALKSLDGSTMEVREARILDNNVKCFVITPPKDTNALKQEVCLTDEGIPLKVDGGDGAVVANLFEREVKDAAFEPPTRPLGAQP